MTDAEQIDAAEPAPGATEAGSWQTRLVLIGVPAVTVGFFFLAWQSFDNTLPDALGAALGAGLGALVALSVLGAVVNARRGRSHTAGAPDVGESTAERSAAGPDAPDQ